MLINIDVDDLDAAIEFYEAALGLELGRRRFGGAVAEMLGASSKLYLLAKPAGSTAFLNSSSTRRYDRHWTPVHLDFEVDDVTAAVERAVRAGAKLEGQIETRSWGRIATMSDPFGHGFCLLQFVGRGYDEVA